MKKKILDIRDLQKPPKGPVQKILHKLIWANNLTYWLNPNIKGGSKTTLACSTRIRSQIWNTSILTGKSDTKVGS